MVSELFLRRCRNWYAKLLRFYPRQHRERCAEGMEQTFNDLCRERRNDGGALFGFMLWMFAETSAGIIKENAACMMKCSMKHGATLFLKSVISFIAIAALAVCFLGLPAMVGQEAAKQRPGTEHFPYVFLACAYILSVPFFVGLHQAFKLLSCIDGNSFFSELAAGALKRIKYSGITISAMMAAGIAALMVLASGKGEDIAGIVALGLLVTLASAAIAALSAVFQRRVQRALLTEME